MFVSRKIEMELNIQVNGKIIEQFMEMEFYNQIQQNILGSLKMVLNIFMVDKQKNKKFIKANFLMVEEKVEVLSILHKVLNKVSLMNI